jgi:arylsulfatase A-like enzyme
MKSKCVRSILSILCLLAASWTLAATSKPNIILIVADDLGYAGLSCYDNAHGIQTPHLDNMAANGLKFTDFHSNGTVCSPTRASLMTGRYQQRTGITGVVKAATCRNQGLALEETTMAEMLKSGGYQTAIFGKWHVGYSPKFNPVNQGFDEYIGFVSGNVDYQSHLDLAKQEDWWKQDQLLPEEGYQTTLIGNHAVDFIGRNKSAPFFLYLAFGAPHSPIQGPNDPPVRGKGAVPAKSIDQQRAYREMIESMDTEIGRVKTSVEELGLAENTFIFFCSDNGHAKNGTWSANPGLRGSKSTVYEGGTRVPGIAYWPGIIQPATTDETAMTMDLYPTYAALSSTPLPEEVKFDGIDLSALLLKGESLPERTLYWNWEESGAVRNGPWKYVLTGKKAALYNLDDDLAESINLASKHPEKFQKMERQYTAWKTEVDTNPSGPEIDPDVSANPSK